MAETLRTEGGRAVLRVERRFTHPQEKVWRALTEPGQLSQWFPATVDFAPEVGADVSYDFGDGSGPTVNGTVAELDPPRVFALTWGGELLRWELRPDGDECVMVFNHTFDDRYGAASFCSGWLGCFDALEQLVGGEPVTHTRPSAALHDAYVARFGLDEGVVEVTPQGWQVRFERQLTQPVDAVWQYLNGSGDPPVAQSSATTVPAEFTAGAVPSGAVVALRPPHTLEYEWLDDDAAAGRVRWELREGTGHGARLVLTQTGPATRPDLRETALSAWRSRIAELAAHLREPAFTQP